MLCDFTDGQSNFVIISDLEESVTELEFVCIPDEDTREEELVFHIGSIQEKLVHWHRIDDNIEIAKLEGIDLALFRCKKFDKTNVLERYKPASAKVQEVVDDSSNYFTCLLNKHKPAGYVALVCMIGLLPLIAAVAFTGRFIVKPHATTGHVSNDLLLIIKGIPVH